jgi:sugar lactone lactonase YvrE
LNSPYGLALDTSGNLYIADLGNGRVRRVTPGGIITTIAGGGTVAAGGVNDGALATTVALLAPRNVTLDASGNLYISDFNGHRVYEVNPGGTLTTVAGTGVQGFSGDGGPAPFAQLAFPRVSPSIARVPSTSPTARITTSAGWSMG